MEIHINTDTTLLEYLMSSAAIVSDGGKTYFTIPDAWFEKRGDVLIQLQSDEVHDEYKYLAKPNVDSDALDNACEDHLKKCGVTKLGRDEDIFMEGAQFGAEWQLKLNKKPLK